MAEESEGTNVVDLSKVEVCVSWVENSLLEYKTTFHVAFDNILGIYLSNGAQTEGLPWFSTLDLFACLAPTPTPPSCTTTQWAYRALATNKGNVTIGGDYPVREF